MWHQPSFTIEIDCREGDPPKPGQTFTLSVVRQEQFEVVHVAAYLTPQRRDDGSMVTHHIRYRRKRK
jgi:hypothetical protein